MFILTPIAINSSLTSKWAHLCIVTVISASLAVSWDSSCFFSDCSDRVPKSYKKGEGIEASILLSTCDEYLFLQINYFKNPNGEFVNKWILNHISKFHDNPMVNKSEIIVLLRQFWVSTGKEKDMICFRNSQRWECLWMSSNPGAQISWWSNSE